MSDPDLPTSIRLPPDLKRWLRSYADEQRRPLSGLVVWVLEQFRKTEARRVKAAGNEGSKT